MTLCVCGGHEEAPLGDYVLCSSTKKKFSIEKYAQHKVSHSVSYNLNSHIIIIIVSSVKICNKSISSLYV